MPHPSKRRGDKAELEIARILHDLTGDDVKRKLGAGRAEDTGDLHGLTDTTAEVKSYTDVLRGIREGLDDLEAEHANAGTPYAVLFVRRRGGQWIAIQTIPQWAAMYRAATV